MNLFEMHKSPVSSFNSKCSGAFLLFLVACSLLSSCSKSTKPKKTVSDPLFVLRDSTQTNINFINYVEDGNEINMFNYEYFYNGGGVAVGDINQDGLADLYFSSTMGFNKLYLNLGNFKFKDITQEAGVDGGLGIKTGVSMVDLNGDGLLDIFVCKSGLFDPVYRENIIYINNGNLTFTNRAPEYHLNDQSFCTQTYFFDMDLDNDLDVFMVNHPVSWQDINNIYIYQDEKGRYYVPEDTNRTYISNRLYENLGNGNFKDVSAKAGIGHVAFGLSLCVLDANEDGYPDLYVCNDYLQPDVLFINNKNHTFTKSFEKYFSHQSHSSMGSEIFDLNNDGKFDLMTVDMKPEDNLRQKTLMDDQNYDRFYKMVNYNLQAQFSKNCVHLNNGNKSYSDISFLLNIEHTDWSWAPIAADYDNDGFEDLYITNGYRRYVTNMDYKKFTLDSLMKATNGRGAISFPEWKKVCPEGKIQNYFFKNNGNLNFTKVSDEWNAGPDSYSNGAAYVDLDNDGDLDIVTNNINDHAFVLENKANQKYKHNYLKINLKGPGKNTQGIGATVILNTVGGSQQFRYVNPVRGFMSSVDPVIHFGLKELSQIENVEVLWPDGIKKRYQSIQINAVNTLDYKEGVSIQDAKKQAAQEPELLQAYDAGIHFIHHEDYYTDFKREPIIHMKNSTEGPALAIGDVNGDGTEDAFLGGAVGQASELYIQSNGTFKLSNQIVFKQDSSYEDVSATFIDIDQDKDLDLYVASGGYLWEKGNKMYQDRLYVNDGKGNFSKSSGLIPQENQNGSIAIPLDVNGDGKQDLFIGGGVTPAAYPYAEESFLLINKDGKYINETKSWFNENTSLGIVKDAVAKDFNNDGKLDLILCGEWMPISIWINTGTRFENKTKEFNLTGTEGWWQSVLLEDLDGDGDLDVVAGNLGQNSKFKASATEPVEVFAADFDNSKTMDAILSTYVMGTSYPVVSRDRLLEQMTSLRKKYLRYASYGITPMNKIVDEDKLQKSYHLKAFEMSSCIFWNESNKFTKQILPAEVQVSMVKGILIQDIDMDGKKDILTCGNFYDTDIDFGRYDASIGCLLLQKQKDSKPDFQAVSVLKSGFYVPGNARRIKFLEVGDSKCIIATENNAMPKLFKIRKK